MAHTGETYSRARGKEVGFVTPAKQIEKTQAGLGGQRELGETP